MISRRFGDDKTRLTDNLALFSFIMTIQNTETITAVNRPVDDLSWVSDVAGYLADNFSRAVILGDPRGFSVDIVKPRELNKVELPPSRSAQYVAEKMRDILPSGFMLGANAATVGAGYFKNEARNRVPLLIKLAAEPELIAENDAVFDALSVYGLSPDNNHGARFNVIIGAVALHQLAGNQKQQLQYGITDRIPKTLALSPGVIRGKRQGLTVNL